MIFSPLKKKILVYLLCIGSAFLPACRTAAFNAAIQGDAATMQQLVNEGACLSEKNAMAVPKNGLYQLFVRLPLGLVAMAWDIGTLGNFFTGTSLAERIIMKKPGDLDDTPINAASLRGYADVVRILLKAGERPDNFTIQKAARENYAAVINEYLNYRIIGTNWKYDNWPLLMWSARDEAPDVTRLLISRGAFVNYSDNKGRTPLYLAAWNDNVEDARALIQAGADIHTVINLANSNADDDKCLEIISTLQRAGAPASAFASHYLYGSNYSPLSVAITRAGASAAQPKALPEPPPAPAPTKATPKRSVDNRMVKTPKKKKAASPAPKAKPAPAPAPKPQQPSRASILQDFT